jgi:hypothetical protein
MHEPSIDQYRYFLKDTIRQEIDFAKSDQNRGVPPPPVEKPFPVDAKRHALTPAGKWTGIRAVDVATAMGNRRSRRSFSAEPLSLDDLSFLLWATQGVRAPVSSGRVFRIVSFAGNRHPFDTYVAVLRVSGLEPGFYRYLPLEYELLHLFHEEQMP